MRIIENIAKYRKTTSFQKRTSNDGRGIRKGSHINIKRNTAMIKGVVAEMFVIKDKRGLWIEYLIELPSGKYGSTDRNDFHNITKVGE